MADEKEVLDSSSSTGNITAADVDFASYEKTFLKELAGEAAPAEEKTLDKPKEAVLAPAGKAPVVEPAEAPKTEPKGLTWEEAERLVDDKLKAAKPKEEPKEDPYPTLADSKFETVEEVEKAQSEWIKRHTTKAVTDALAERDKAGETAKTQAEQIAQQQKSWDEREAEAKTRHADYDELKKLAATRPFNETALQFIVDSKVGPDLFVHYIKNEQDWKDLIAMPPEDIKLEMRQVERELRRNVVTMTPKETAPKGKTVSDAPPPLKKLAGGGAPAEDPREKAAQDGDFATFERLRTAELARDKMGRFT